VRRRRRTGCVGGEEGGEGEGPEGGGKEALVEHHGCSFEKREGGREGGREGRFAV